MELVLASRNRKKAVEIGAILSSLGLKNLRLLSLADIGYEEEIEENGATFEENAMIKASVPASLGYYGIADDSGLEVDALCGRPGIYSARYAALAGEHPGDEANNQKLLKEMANVPEEKRTARFVCAAALCVPDGKPGESFVLRGACEGRILTEASGDGGFGYDPLFWCDALGQSFGTASDTDKNAVSHRYAAFRLLAKRLAEVFPELRDEQNL